MLIGITGKAGHGKDTVADMIMELLPRTDKYSFAAPLKAMALAIDPIIEGDKRLSDFVANPDGWHAAKKHTEVRRFLQRLGTEGVRGTFGDNAWVDLMFDWWYSGNASYGVIPDTRFPNEAEAIWAEDGIVIKVVRMGAGDLGVNASHASEQDLEADYVIWNDGSLEDLHYEVIRTLKEAELL